MSRRRGFKKILAVITVSAMMLGLSIPMSVVAAGGTQKAYISKTFNTQVGKAASFTFKAKQDITTSGVVTTAHPITTPNISFTALDTGTTTKSGQIGFGTFVEAGKYVYFVTESSSHAEESTHEKWITSKAEYKMEVYVEDNGSHCDISNIIVTKTKEDDGTISTGTSGKVDIGDGTSGTNGFNFVNTYVQEAGTGDGTSLPGTDYVENGSLKVSKIIDENGGSVDADKIFNFTATFIFPTRIDANTLGGIKGNGSVISLTAGVYKFSLKHNESMKFTGLPVGTTVIVKEDAVANYKGSAKVIMNDGAVEDITSGKYNDATIVSGKILGQKKNTIDVTNTYNYVPPTGIIMNTLPYILMIVLCTVALIVYVSSKRRKFQK